MTSKEVVVGKIPPQNIDAEKSLLGAVLIDEETLADISENVTIKDFYERRHAIIYGGMMRLYEKHKPVDLLTLTDELKRKKELDTVGGSAYLTELTNYVPTAAHATAYAELVAQKAVRRRLIKASGDISELGYNEETSTEELLEKAEAELFSVSDQSLRQDLVSIESILTESFDRMEELQRNKGALRGVRTGYKDLDNMTAGLQKSDLIILAARPAMGKTTLVTNLAYNVATIAKQPVLFFSLEMSKEQLVDRMLADASGVDAWNIRTGNLSDEDFGKISEAMGELAEAPIYIDDTPGLSVLQMRTKARRATHDQPLGLIIVDYLQLMQGSGYTASNRVQEVSEISRGLKLIARELNVPVVALSQLSRSVESRSPQIPQLADLRESGSIEQDADIVMFIYREAYYNPETERENITDLIIAKHRNGPTGKVELYFHPERLRFMSIDRKHDA
ncbi:replicative DNA helicase [Candidatus Saccharibacteria bacterium CG11_big_fil_rev_8_21_14_0_20_41_19]|nr:MAG: replicative DNA helicase [Candidatus Saccharibacteria bacterium CG2_30_41_52]PIQ71119.1 MAG: replicative DNA helicase [Candidatus Saccharibacteria bacterium CG11_big_fil_rev_8_21_14_0_20_41_19]PIZ59935.1 MAG: replicative DNA helicase [Candidatus Saccharibacteria bacterium CG_4_10_14_0_2_um_filter_41_11]PJC29718.1 MAG: replicative DNA helicase [Candidatus Saccharibacteria bacterium CG_4_9_14_0_2_um_filter_41_9]PJE65979.1 MAG: replicative DNA helicase [Candidatus Saccharibacteria bacteriu